ncbi:MAG: response regulator, partial [Acidimicrobiales bacterium]
DSLNAILDATDNTVVELDAAGTITGWNPAATRMFGWAADEVRGRALVDILVPGPDRGRSASVLESLVAEGHAVGPERRVEFLGLHRDGRELSLAMRVWPVGPQEGAPLIGLIERTTARTQVDETLRVHTDAAQASRLKTVVLANMSHEVRTAMNGVIGMSQLLLDTDLDARQVEYASAICASGESLLANVHDIFDFAKLQDGELRLDVQDVQVASIVQDVARALAPEAFEKGLELVARVGSETPAYVQADGDRLRRILYNLAGNAVRYTTAGEVVIDVDRPAWPERREGPAWPERREGPAWPERRDRPVLRFEVRDTFHGTPAERLAAGSGDSGPGLAVSTQLIELMGGVWGAESRPGVSAFWFTVPVSLGATPAPMPPLLATLRGVRALVVDDNATNRTVVSEILNAHGMRTVCAGDGGEALDALRVAAAEGRPFAVVLIDRLMPGMDGLDLARAIHADPALAGVRLVMLSSFDGAEDRREALSVGFADYVSKPLGRTDLLNCLARLCFEPQGTSFTSPRQVRVLVVDDDRTSQRVAAAMLENAGMTVEVVADGLLALQALRTGAYDVVLMDGQMPNLDGIEATRQLRQREGGVGRTPVIALTARTATPDRERFLAAGVDDYLTKPFRQEDLLATVLRWAAAPRDD